MAEYTVVLFPSASAERGAAGVPHKIEMLF